LFEVFEGAYMNKKASGWAWDIWCLRKS